MSTADPNGPAPDPVPGAAGPGGAGASGAGRSGAGISGAGPGGAGISGAGPGGAGISGAGPGGAGISGAGRGGAEGSARPVDGSADPLGSGDGPGGDGAGTGGDVAGGAAEERAARKREHAVRGTLAAALILEGITVLFVPQTIAAIGDDGLGGRRLTVLLVLAAALFVAAGIQKRPAGLVLGTVLQVAVILTGVMVGAMYFLGLLFAAVWGFLLWVRQEVGRAAARAAAARAGSTPA